MGDLAGNVLRCVICSQTYTKVDGIWQFVLEEQQPDVERFVSDYAKARGRDPRLTPSAVYYLDLPYVDRSDPHFWQWTARAASWDRLQRLVRRLPPNRRILDVGAGVGWLSHRLAQLGHSPLAIDVIQDPVDGLRAARHYPGGWPRAWADFDHLPVADRSADVVVYEASFHYSVDFDATMQEARRVLKRRGLLVIMDTPTYRNAADGQRMMQARRIEFERRHGPRSDLRPTIGFLDKATIDSLAEVHGIQWRRARVRNALRAGMRPLARLAGSREPSRFEMLVGRWK